MTNIETFQNEWNCLRESDLKNKSNFFYRKIESLCRDNGLMYPTIYEETADEDTWITFEWRNRNGQSLVVFSDKEDDEGIQVIWNDIHNTTTSIDSKLFKSLDDPVLFAYLNYKIMVIQN